MKLRVAMIATAMVLGIVWSGSGQLIRQSDSDGVSRVVLASSSPGDSAALASMPPGRAVTVDGIGQATPTASNRVPKRQDIPEPTTIIAGALLLLPFVASALRILRKRRKAA
jgi:hypothetical protein